jgi:large subunit ribosomal protein L7/L12
MKSERVSNEGGEFFMAKLSKDDILKAVEDMSVLELSELVKALEEKFGVSAAPVAVAAAAGAAASAEPKEEQTVFNVMLTSFGENKIGVIKAVRELVPTLGLAEAKALVESAPKEIMTSVNKQTGEEAKKKLEAAGAKVDLK